MEYHTEYDFESRGHIPIIENKKEERMRENKTVKEHRRESEKINMEREELRKAR